MTFEWLRRLIGDLSQPREDRSDDFRRVEAWEARQIRDGRMCAFCRRMHVACECEAPAT